MTQAPLPASLLAFATTVHIALLVLRRHRHPAGSFPWPILPSLAFAAGPWVFPTAAGTAAGLLVHLAWFAACEWLIPRPTPPSISTAAAPPPPAPAARPIAAPRDFVPLPVLAVVDESPTIRTFRLARPSGFDFVAGQFLTVRIQADGQPLVRCYSISSAPEASGYLEISVKRQGRVSGLLHATVRPGSHLMVRPPAGRFVYPARDDRPLVLVAGGVGITPLVSMLRHAAATEPGRPVTLLYSARGRDELAFADELGWLARRHPQVRVVTTMTGPEGGAPGGGRITGALLAAQAPDAAHTLFLICGPDPMIRDVRAALADLGVPADQVRSEVFQPAAAIGARPAAEVDADAAPAGAEGGVTLTLARSRQTVPVPEGRSLLEAAESAGAALPSLCRAGVCRTCRTRLVSGDVACSSDALDHAERAEGWTLRCVAWAWTDCTLDA